MTDQSLSAKRSAAGKRGAAARWGPTNATAAGPTAPEPDGLVCGTAAELREMAEALNGGARNTIARTRNISASRVKAYKARHPHATDATLRGRVVCEPALAERPRADAPRLRVVVNEGTAPDELWLYDTIDSYGGDWGISAAEVIDALSYMSSSAIDVHINSPGGEVFEGIAIKRALAAHPADVRVCIDSVAASIASVIAMAGDPICMDSSAMLMIHEASGFAMGNAADMLQMASLLDKVSTTIAAVYQARAGGDLATWRNAMLAETWYTAAEAMEAGLADEYLDNPQLEPDEDDQEAADIAASADLFLLTASSAATTARTPVDSTPDFQFLDALRRQHTS